MVMMQSRSAAEFDAAARVNLVPAGGQADATPETRLTHAAVPLDLLLRSTGRDATKGAYWDDDTITGGLLLLNLFVTEHSNEGDTYIFTVETHAVDDFASPRTPVLTFTLDSTMNLAGRLLQFAVSAATIKALVANAAWLALCTEVNGGAPSITYTSWLSHVGAA